MGVNCKYWYPCRVWRKVFLAGVVCAKNMIEARGHTSAIERIHCHFDRVEFLFKTQKEALFSVADRKKKKEKESTAYSHLLPLRPSQDVLRQSQIGRGH